MDKKCARCGVVKDVSNYHRNKSQKDGYQKRCKQCRAEHAETTKEQRSDYHKSWYQINKEKFLNACSAYRKTEKWRIVNKNGNKKYTEKYPDKYKAHYSVGNAVKLGKLPKIKTLICSVCKKSTAEQYHHHKGYDEKHWLDVIPVCSVCHKIVEKL